MSHYVSPSCGGEKCVCGAPATHKVGEENTGGDWMIAGDAYSYPRHNLTSYICCEHFGFIMGPLAREWCAV